MKKKIKYTNEHLGKIEVVIHLMNDFKRQHDKNHFESEQIKC